MTLAQIEQFLMVAKYQNITEAAGRMYISQPTLSRKISSMEKELNMLLFERHGNSLKLTPAGIVLSERLSGLIDIYHSAIKDAQDVNWGMKGEVTVGILHGHIVEDFFPRYLTTLNRLHSNISITVKRESFSYLVEGLLDYSFDFILTMNFDIANMPAISYFPIETVSNYIAVSNTHPTASIEATKLLDFRNDTLIVMSEKDSANGHNKSIRACKNAGFTPNIKVASTLEEYMLLIETGFGYAVLSEKNSLYLNSNIRFIEIEELNPSEVVFAWNPKNQNSCLPLCLNILKDFLGLTSGKLNR